ncbi:hypothetical protein N7468_003447 [Penicillium chermesinum]|uniref:Uncharacterized protein n=1 Tax=Penicillium chermesinum TaxID=63820 RepID=A0A9W9P929_9EURO|nr:uncharacterized protein N7468_003447 [Penicillium chermesinum]KAJ5238828.1 hypothetical protein N7468_003447 [Penicillium chermesinum]KAJ6164465.1 hypothetical protein N7470_003137 [Penicillium chermesinum]
MQYRWVASTLFAAIGIASPAPQIPDLSNLIPTSIEQILQTAIPTTWADAFATDRAFFSSAVSAMQSGSYPDWESSLPTDMSGFFTSEVQAEISSLTVSGGSFAGSYFSSLLSSATATQMNTAVTTDASISGASSSGVSTSDASISRSSISGFSSPGVSSSGASSSGASFGPSSSNSKMTMTDSPSQSVTASSTATTQSSSAASTHASGRAAIGLAGVAGILGIAIAL